MKYLSLFSGVGGFELGIGNKAECIAYSEIDKYAISIYEKHFPTHTNFGDITTINTSRLPDFDLLVGGVPCQSWSIAGKRGGFDDKRGEMWFETFRIVEHKQPNYLLLENVKGLLSHDKGKSIEVILERLQEMGYYVNMEVRNSKNYGVPQNRERVFLLCRHIKTLIKDGQKLNLRISKQIISEFLFQILLNNLKEVQKLQGVRSKDWVIGYLLSKEINQNLKSKDGNIKDGIMIPMAGRLFQSEDEEVWQNIGIWLNKNLGEDLQELNKSIILTAINKTIELKTYTYSKMLQSILLVIVLLRNSSKDLWNKILSDLILIKEDTNKYARINDKKKKIIVTETGNAYLTFNLPNTKKHFIIGHLGKKSRPKVFPIRTGDKKFNRETDKQRCSNTLTGRSAGGQNRRGNYIKISKNGKVKKDQNNAATLTGGAHSGGNHSDMDLIVRPVLTPDRPNKRQDGRRFKEDGDPSFTITSQDRHGVALTNKNELHAMRWQRTEKGKEARRESQKKGRDYTPFSKGHRELVPVDGKPVGALTAQAIAKDSLLGNNTQIRRLTPTECERLQGFPDGWTKVGVTGIDWHDIEISDTQRYKCLGNAVTTNVVKAIMERLL